MATYSFLDVTATLTGPGGSVNLASGAAVAKEGITIEQIEDKSTMVLGADGGGVHSLMATTARSVTIRLLKTSPTNAVLQNMFNYQTTSSARHGRNVIVVRDASRGDLITLNKVAFKGEPSITYAAEAGTMEWKFDAIESTTILGTGTPEAE